MGTPDCAFLILGERKKGKAAVRLLTLSSQRGNKTQIFGVVVQNKCHGQF